MKAGPQILEAGDIDWPALLPRGGMVVWGQAAAEPLTLTEALMAARHEVGGFRAGVGLVLSDSVAPEHADCVSFISYTGGARNRKLAQAGKLDILPLTYRQFADALSPVDLLLLHLPPAGSDGTYPVGLCAEYIADLVGRARVVVAQVNSLMPATFGSCTVHPGQIDYIVRSSRPLPAMPVSPPDCVTAKIAQRIAGLVEDGATLQMGIGNLPDSIMDALGAHRDLGVHSGTVGDGVARLAEAGVITNARKSMDIGVTVTGAVMGGPESWRWAQGNRTLCLAPTSYTHDPARLAAQERFTAINSAIEVDLTGQINAEVADATYLGAVGAAGDFMRAAALSRGGLPVIALPSIVSKTGQSRIVAQLSGPVSTARSDAGIIVTEHGIADLRGCTLRERRRRMIDIAAPEHRAALDAANP
ncbi:acetyl-CoA hydrolase/transferase family protein [Aquamicrobium defluvii]|uniref:Acetyl-CoA hydrolase n=1 Tax=Aquamicrobium defluvii TaxID=69279 RepID=A0A011TDH0_9HYPH|nr:acetyl-CoA hydrolase/transferase C-terminal domain-containing protein [Aquamicrobium defluvii]EXL01912.1 acetyl-CoA hydrolase [Aquamicrobium defluvii]EZQ12874.1 acetyl-CoA hydrolase [Halopseudomonas bauzanensis]TDR31915.1 acetyl-CoA hydrolase [Aquamicrobium defluvii]